MIGDDIFPNEETYQTKVGSLVTTIDVFVKRMTVKDKALQDAYDEIQQLKDKLKALEPSKEVE